MAQSENRALMDVAHVSSKGTSFRITIPRKVVKMLDLKDQDIIAFYREGSRVIIESLK